MASGCANIDPNKNAQAAIIREAPRLIGPADSYAAHVHSDIFSLGRGYVRSVTIDGDNVRMSPEITLSSLEVTLNDIHFDRSSHAIKHIGTIAFAGNFGQQSLDHYLQYKYPHIKETLSLDGQRVYISLPLTMWKFGTTAHVSGIVRVSPQNPSAIEFVGESAHVGIMPIPVRLVNEALKHINPIAVFNSKLVALNLTDAEVDHSQIHVFGTATLTGQLPSP